MLNEAVLEFVKQLIRDDMSRACEGVQVERKGEVAIDGWKRAAGEAGDMEMIKAIARFDREDLVDAWNYLIDEMAPEGEVVR